MHPSDPTKVPICFGYETALELLDAASRCGALPAKTRRRDAPRHIAAPEHIAQAARTCTSALAPAFSPTKPLHLITSNTTERRRTSTVISHRIARPLRGSWFDVLALPDTTRSARTPSFLVPDAAFLFAQMACLLPFVTLLELGYELCGTYRRPRNGQALQCDTPPLTSPQRIARFVEMNPHINGAAKAKQALPYLAPFSASPRETKAALILGLPTRYGGYGLGVPRMNHEVECSAAARAIVGSKTLRCDLYWPEAQLDLEYQSRAHHEGEQSRIHDARRAHALKSMGIQVSFLTGEDLDSIQAMDVIAATIRKALGKRNRIRTERYHEKKLRLRRQLCLPVESYRTYPVAQR